MTMFTGAPVERSAPGAGLWETTRPLATVLEKAVELVPSAQFADASAARAVAIVSAVTLGTMQVTGGGGSLPPRGGGGGGEGIENGPRWATRLPLPAPLAASRWSHHELPPASGRAATLPTVP